MRQHGGPYEGQTFSKEIVRKTLGFPDACESNSLGMYQFKVTPCARDCMALFHQIYQPSTINLSDQLLTIKPIQFKINCAIQGSVCIPSNTEYVRTYLICMLR